MARPAAIRAGLPLLGLVALLACAPGPEVAPPATDLVRPAGGGNGPGTVEVLRRGRLIYLKDCARCHRPVAIGDLPAARWRSLLPDMIRRARLTPRQGREVTSYIEAVLESAAGPADR